MENQLAQWLGTHVIEVFLILLLLTLPVILLLWHLLDRYHGKVWDMGATLWQRVISSDIVQRVRQRYPQLDPFYKHRLSPHGYLLIYLAVGLVLSLVAFSGFSTLAEEVTEQDPLVYFDQVLATTLHRNVTPIEIQFFKIVTSLAGRIGSIVIGVGVGLVLLALRRRLLLISWVVAVLGNSLLNAVLKAVFQRMRPEFADPILTAPNYSFPSGHAMGSVVMYGMLTYLLFILLKGRLKRSIVVVAVTLILVIGLSRLYLGVHYFSDVLAGFMVGFGWLAIVIVGTEAARRRKRLRQRLASTPKSRQETASATPS
jgi:undecaprenyl-diphosphatase